MRNQNNNNNRNLQDRTYLSRDEFEVFEKNVDRNFTDLGHAVSNLNAKLDKLNTTDWKTYGMVAGLIITIFSLGGSLLVRDFNKLESTQVKDYTQLSKTLTSVTSKIEDTFNNINYKLETVHNEVDNVAISAWSKEDQRHYTAGQKTELIELRAEIKEYISLVLELTEEKFINKENDNEYKRL